MSKISFRRLSLRRVLFVLSGILTHYVGYYSFYRVYSFITSGIITSGIITSGIITSVIITSGIEPTVRFPRCFKTKKKRKNIADIIAEHGVISRNPPASDWLIILAFAYIIAGKIMNM